MKCDKIIIVELKEIVNLRKLREYFDEVLPKEQCDFCPLRNLCPGSVQELGCLAKKMLGETEEQLDLYDLEAEAIACAEANDGEEDNQ